MTAGGGDGEAAGGEGDGGEGEGGGGEGDGGDEEDGGGGLGEGDGKLASQQAFLHLLRCLKFMHLLTFSHFFLFAVSVRPLHSSGPRPREGGGGL